MTTSLDTSYLQKTSLAQLTNWSVRYLLETSFSYNEKFDLVPIGSFLKRRRDIIHVEDDIEYQQVTVKINGNGVEERDWKFGKDIGTKRQYKASAGQFIMSKIDARNGAFGIVPEELDGAMVTNDFPVFDIDTEKILPQFFVLLTSTKEFISFAQSCSSGTTNRQRIDLDMFLGQSIPLPDLTEQSKIINSYNGYVNDAIDCEKSVLHKEYEIEKYLLQELGLEKLEEKISKQAMQLINFSDLERWDHYSKDQRILNSLSKSNYELVELQDKFRLPRRTWNSKKKNDGYFSYIEIGSIDPLYGVLEYSKLKVKEAPSRATQVVKEGDLIIGTTRPYLKRFAIINSEFDEFVCSSGFTIIGSLSDEYDLIFLKEFLMSYYGIEQLKNKMSGATYPAITVAKLKEVLIPFPPVEIQKRIANRLEGLREQIKTLKKNAKIKRDEAFKEFEKIIFG